MGDYDFGEIEPLDDGADLDDEILADVHFLMLEYLDGDKSALLVALLNCFDLRRSPMPEWVSKGVEGAIEKWLFFEKKTLDEAFDVVRPKGFNLNAHKKDHDIGVEAYLEVLRLANERVAIDEGMFERIGSQLNISGSQAKKYYYKRHNRLRDMYRKYSFEGKNSKKS